jgi:cohesin loading factor subunit SCC2
MTIDGSSPLLNPNVIRKLAKYIGQVTRPTKRIRLSVREGATGSGGTPRGKGRMAEVDTAILSRVLKILDRSVRTGEDLDPFHYVAADRNASPRKPKKVVKRPKAKDGEGDEGHEPENPADEPPPPPQEVTGADLDHLTKILEIAKDSVLAADCCIALLGSDRLTKQV